MSTFATGLPASLRSVRRWFVNTGNEGSLRVKFAPHLCAMIVLALNLAFYAKAAPTLRLVENAVCREHYQEHDPSKIGPGGFVDEAESKLSVIQKKVAWLFMATQL